MRVRVEWLWSFDDKKGCIKLVDVCVSMLDWGLKISWDTHESCFNVDSFEKTRVKRINQMEVKCQAIRCLLWKMQLPSPISGWDMNFFEEELSHWQTCISGQVFKRSSFKVGAVALGMMSLHECWIFWIGFCLRMQLHMQGFLGTEWVFHSSHAKV
jgi:hypothetical protein